MHQSVQWFRGVPSCLLLLYADSRALDLSQPDGLTCNSRTRCLADKLTDKMYPDRLDRRMRAESRKKRVGAAFVVAAITLSATSACGGGQEAAEVVTGSWDQVLEAANSEGQVSLYTTLTPSQNTRLEAAFEQEYPSIDLVVTRGSGGDVNQRIQQEIASGTDGADTYIEAIPSWFVDHKADLLEINGPSVEGWDKDAWAVPDKAIIPSTYANTSFIWNTKLVPQGIDDYKDFLAPDLTGRIGYVKVETPTYLGLLEFLRDELGVEYLQSLSEQKPKFYQSVVPLAQAVAAGEIAAAPVSVQATVIELKSQGAPIESYTPTVGYGVSWGGAALAKSKRPNAARVFIDFVMSAKGQSALNADGYGAAGREGIRGALNLDQFTILDSSRYTPEVTEEVKAELHRYFG
jgi:iron(III) transport system substrate-binding protein